MRISYIVAVWAVGILGVAHSGCCKSTKVQDCNLLINAVNTNVSVLGSARSVMKTTPNAASIEGLAKAYERAGDNVKAVTVTDTTLKGYAVEYHNLFDGAAKNVRDTLVAVRLNDKSGLTRAIAEEGRLTERESALQAKITGYCAK